MGAKKSYSGDHEKWSTSGATLKSRSAADFTCWGRKWTCVTAAFSSWRPMNSTPGAPYLNTGQGGSLEHCRTIITTRGGAKISRPANWQYGNKNQPSSSANHWLHDLHNVPLLNKSKPLRRETTHYVPDTQLNTFIRAPPHVRFMLQLPWNSSIDNNYNHFLCICNNWYTCMKKLWKWNVFIAKIESLLLLLSMHSQRYHSTTNVKHIISMSWWRNYNNHLQLKWVQWLNGLINFWFWGKPTETTHSPPQTDSLVVYILI